MKQQLCYFGHIARKPLDSIENEVHYGIVEGKRDGGWSKTQWIDNVMITAKTTDLYLLIQMAQNRKKLEDAVPGISEKKE